MKWKEPSKPNGIILNYRLSWKYVGTLFDSDNRNGEEDFNSKTQENTTGNLRKGSTFICTQICWYRFEKIEYSFYLGVFDQKSLKVVGGCHENVWQSLPIVDDSFANISMSYR